MRSGCPEIPDNHVLIKLTLSKNIADMHGNGLFAFAEQPTHMFLCEPDRLVLKPDVEPDVSPSSS